MKVEDYEKIANEYADELLVIMVERVWANSDPKKYVEDMIEIISKKDIKVLSYMVLHSLSKEVQESNKPDFITTLN